MNKEEFIAKEKKLTERVKLIQEECDSLEKEYILSNQNYPIGSILKVTYQNGESVIGKVESYSISADNDVLPNLIMCDGNGFRERLHVLWWRNPEIELIDGENTITINNERVLEEFKNLVHTIIWENDNIGGDEENLEFAEKRYLNECGEKDLKKLWFKIQKYVWNII